MTAVSTLMAIGMMPLNLLIYSRSWTDTALVIPYINILKSFGMTIGPAVVGILVRWKIQKLADILVKVSKYEKYTKKFRNEKKTYKIKILQN